MKRKVHKRPYYTSCLRVMNFASPVESHRLWSRVTCKICLSKRPESKRDTKLLNEIKENQQKALDYIKRNKLK